jgi:hypothetical protein
VREPLLTQLTQMTQPTNCGFGLVCYYHWGWRFCRKACKDNFLAKKTARPSMLGSDGRLSSAAASPRPRSSRSTGNRRGRSCAIHGSIAARGWALRAGRRTQRHQNARISPKIRLQL